MSLGSSSRPIWPDIFCKSYSLRGLYNCGRGIYAYKNINFQPGVCLCQLDLCHLLGKEAESPTAESKRQPVSRFWIFIISLPSQVHVGVKSFNMFIKSSPCQVQHRSGRWLPAPLVPNLLPKRPHWQWTIQSRILWSAGRFIFEVPFNINIFNNIR